MTDEARRLLVATVDAVAGVSWGRSFGRIVDALEASECRELLDPLAAASDLDEFGAWGEVCAAVGRRGRLVALDLVTELGERADARERLDPAPTSSPPPRRSRGGDDNNKLASQGRRRRQ